VPVRVVRVAVITLVGGLLMATGVAFAAANHVKIKLPATIPESGYFSYTVSGSVDVKGASSVDVLNYEASHSCSASLRSALRVDTPTVERTKRHFTIGQTGAIGAGQTVHVCAYVYAHVKNRRKEIATAGVKVKSSATSG